MDWWNSFINFIADPNAQALLTVAGLGIFLRVILIPVVKWFSENVYPKKVLTGVTTVVVVHIAALVTVIVVTLVVQKPLAIGPIVLLAWSATKDALGLKTQTNMITKPDKM